MDISEEKKTLRKTIRLRKAHYSPEQMRQLSAPITARLLAHPHIQAAHTVMLYYSLPDEVYTHDLVDILAKAGKTVLLPKVVSRDEMEARQYRGRQHLRPGVYQLMEPDGSPYPHVADTEVVVVPGVSFDAKGNRLGHGRGYYDKFLAAMPRAYKIGVCFDFQITPRVPVSHNDMSMDEVITNAQG